MVPLACPRRPWTDFRSAPDAMSREAAVWRRSWIRVPVRPALFRDWDHFARSRKFVLVQIVPVGEGNR